MRSRDGTKTICVVCEPVQTAPIVSAPQASTIPSIPSNFSTILPSSSVVVVAAGSQFYSSVATGILKSLNDSINVESYIGPTENFIKKIESALPALQKCSPISNSDIYEVVLGKVRSQINYWIACPHLTFDRDNALISHFELIGKLLKVLRQLEGL